MPVANLQVFQNRHLGAVCRFPNIFNRFEHFKIEFASGCHLPIFSLSLIVLSLNKTGGGIILYFRKSLNCKRRRELEISKTETLWAEIA